MVGLDVGRYDGKCQVLQEFTKHVVAAVKLMITKTHAVKSKLVDRLGNLFSAIESIEEGPLKLVTHIQK